MIDGIRDKLKSEDDTDIVTNILSKYDFNKYAVADENGSQSIVIYKFARTLRGSTKIDKQVQKLKEIRTELQNQLDCDIGYTLEYDRAIIRIDPDDPRYYIHPYLQYSNIDRRKISKIFYSSIKYTTNSNKPKLDCAVITSKFVERDDYYKTLSEKEDLEYDDLVNHEIEIHDIALLSIANGFAVKRTTPDCIYLSYNSESTGIYESLEELRKEAWNLGYRIGYDVNPYTNQIYVHVNPDHPMSYLAPLSGYFGAIDYYVDALRLSSNFEETVEVGNPYYDAIVIYALVMDSNRTEEWFDVIERYDESVDRQQLEERYSDVSSRIAIF